MSERLRAAAEKATVTKDTVTVQLEGELDHCSADRVRASLDALIAEPSIKRLVIDMRKLSFMDSSGIGVIIGRYRTLAKRNGSVAIRGANPTVDRIFKMSGLYQIIEKCR